MGEKAGLTPTPIQRWFFGQQFENPHYYNQSVLFETRRPLDVAILGQAFSRLLEHHDTLRVNYDPETHSFFYNYEHIGNEYAIRENLRYRIIETHVYLQ